MTDAPLPAIHYPKSGLRARLALALLLRLTGATGVCSARGGAWRGARS